PTEDFTAGGFADRKAEALLRLVEAVAEVEVGPAIGGGNGFVHLGVEFSEFLNVGVVFVGIVETVIGLGQTFLVALSNLLAMVVIRFAYGTQHLNAAGQREGF